MPAADRGRGVSTMTHVPPWYRGPLPSNVVPIKPSLASAAPAPASEPLALVPEPTVWKRLANGRRVVVNPNVCMHCHRGRHRRIRHHEFLPDEATETDARALGWPIPTNQDPLL